MIYNILSMSIASDIGGVLLASKYGETADHEGRSQFLNGAKEGLATLSEKYCVYLLSFCGKKTEMETRQTLKENNIHHIVPEERWIFTRKRELKPVEMQKRGISLLIDDRQDIIENVLAEGLKGIVFTQWTAELLEEVDRLMM